MLKLDLGRLERKRRLPIEARLGPDDAGLAGAELRLAGPLEVRLEAQLAGHDVVVRGQFSGEVRLACRRCLKEVVLAVAEEVAFVYARGVTGVEAEQQEVYPLPERSAVLDLEPAVREHVLLAVPRLVECSVACRGLCPQCGTNRNEGECACREEETDARWGPLHDLKFD
jgi:uncharacterized protein